MFFPSPEASRRTRGMWEGALDLAHYVQGAVDGGAFRALKHCFLCYRAVSPLGMKRTMPCATQDFAGTANRAEQRGSGLAVPCPSFPLN